MSKVPPLFTFLLDSTNALSSDGEKKPDHIWKELNKKQEKETWKLKAPRR